LALFPDQFETGPTPEHVQKETANNTPEEETWQKERERWEREREGLQDRIEALDSFFEQSIETLELQVHDSEEKMETIMAEYNLMLEQILAMRVQGVPSRILRAHWQNREQKVRQWEWQVQDREARAECLDMLREGTLELGLNSQSS
jgi:hypothetical protein